MDTSTPCYKCLDSLVKTYDHWLPLSLVVNGMYYNWDSSKIEGIFGLLKGNYDRERRKITTVINNLNNFCSVLKAQSLLPK